MGWRAVTASDPCPICGSGAAGLDANCAITGNEVWCTGNLDLKQAPVGWVVRGAMGPGVHYIQAGRQAALDAADVEAIKAAAAEGEKAKNLWKRCRHVVEGSPPGCPEGMGPNHHRMRAYFEARGIPLDRLPFGTIPVSLRYYGRCVRGKDKIPAIVCGFANHGGKVTGVQRIFLDPAGEPRKIDNGRDKMQLGDFGSKAGGGAVRLSPKDDVNGVLVLTEGIETGLAVLAALRDTGATVWALVSTSGLQNFRLHPKDAMASIGGWVKRVIIAGDYDHEVTKNGMTSRPGSHFARMCAEQLKADWSDLAVSVAMPSHALVPDLITVDGWVKHGEKIGEENQLLEGKSVDWLDVLIALGADRTAEAVYQPLDLENGVDLDAAKKKTDGDVKQLPDTATERAKLVLKALWSPSEPYGAWRIRRLQKSWWVRDEDGIPIWRQVDDEFVEAKVRHFFDPYLIWKNNRFEAAAISGSAIAEICKAMIAFVGVVDQEMPQWLPASVDAKGNALPQSVLRFVGEAPAGPIAPDGVVCARNGLLDVDAWCADESRVIIHPPSTKWFNSNCLPYKISAEILRKIDSDDPQSVYGLIRPHAPVFCRFLDELTQRDAERQDALRDYAGYLLTAFNVYRKMLWMQGVPKGGKSLWGKLMCRLVGKGNYATATWGVAESKFNASLVGPNLIFIDDLRIPRKSDTAEGLSRFLSMTSGAEMQREDKHIRAAKAARFPGKFIVCTNDDPEIPDNSGAFVDRMLFVRTGGRPKKVDPFLLDKLEAEIEWIMVWALVGLRELRRRGGFVQPSVDADALGDIQRALQPVNSYVSEEYLVSSPWQVKTKEGTETRAWCVGRKFFCERFNTWMKEESPSHKPWSEKSIWRQLQSAGLSLLRDSREVAGQQQDVYVGMRPFVTGENRKKPWPDADVAPREIHDAMLTADAVRAVDPYLWVFPPLAPDPHI